MQLGQYDPVIVEAGWIERWQDVLKNEKPQTSVESNRFSLLLPPPNVTGVLHIGHALTVAIEDSLVRWNRQLGKSVCFIAGLDHAGIATQSMVEKHLMHSQQKTRHDLGREEFIATCHQFVSAKSDNILTQLKRLGCSARLDHPYYTLDDRHSKAVDEAFVRMFNKGLIYRAKRIVNWCPKLQTCISTVEVEHREESGKLYFIDYPLSNGGSIEVATTRPETILGDSGIALHPDDDRRPDLTDLHAVNPITGCRLKIVFEDWVDRNFGTGAVKLTPAHSAEDYDTALKHDLLVLQVFNERSIVVVDGAYKGLHVYQARAAVLKTLEAQHRIKNIKKHVHKVAYCSRSGDTIEPMLKWQWFVKTSSLAAKALEAVESSRIKMQPKTATKTWQRWLRDTKDWCISRQLVWGHQIPVYFDSSTSRWFAATSPEEAATIAGHHVSREEDVLDTWFSSSLLPLSIAGWPETLDRNVFPLNVLETGHDILYFWVARMVMMSLALTDEVPFEQISLHNLVRDADGRKMSKSLGNVIDPLDVINGKPLQEMQDDLQRCLLSDKERRAALKRNKSLFPNGIKACGSDALRFTLLELTTQSTDINLDVKKLVATRHWCNKLYNAVRFCLRYDDFQGDIHQQSMPMPCIWIIRQCRRSFDQMHKAMTDLRPCSGCSVLRELWQANICDIFIELVKNSDDTVKGHYVNTLRKVVEYAIRLLHAFMPYLSEYLWQTLNPNIDCLFSMTTGFEIDDYDHFDVDEGSLDEEMSLLLKAAQAIRSASQDLSAQAQGFTTEQIQTLSKYRWELNALSRDKNGLSQLSVLS